MADTFGQGELFVYVNGDRWELGQVKECHGDNKYACWYSTGDTAAVTSAENMHKLENAGWSHIERDENTAQRRVIGEITKHCECGGCLAQVGPYDNYCRECGRRLI